MKKALVIDDVEVSRYACRIFLEEMDFSCEEAATGEEGLNKLGSGGFHLILLDWHLKKMNGLELIEKIRKTAAGASVPVIVISGVESQDKESKARDAGAAAFIVKPMDGEKLKRAIDKAGLS